MHLANTEHHPNPGSSPSHPKESWAPHCVTRCVLLTLPRQKNTMARHTRLPVHPLKAAPGHNQLKYQVFDT